jgi:hypothetical protein
MDSWAFGMPKAGCACLLPVPGIFCGERDCRTALELKRRLVYDLEHVMMDFMRIFDSYSLRARLFPAIIAVAPAFAALALMISWKSFEVSNAVATIAVLVILFAIADLARSRGRAIEAKIYAENGGMPSITMFRRSDATINEFIKERYRAFLATKLRVAAPIAEAERADQYAGDSFYEQCGIWLRQSTRDTKKFPLLFSENVTYGFRRNLFGVKWLALAVNLAVVVICLLLLWRDNWAWQSVPV